MKFDRAVKHFGTQNAIAEALGISPAAVSKWKESGLVPIKRAVQLANMSRGRLKVDTRDYQ